MLSAECHETQPAPAAEPVPSAVSLRRIAVSFAPEGRQAQSARHPQRQNLPAVRLPPYSRIVFRAGSISVR